MAYQSLYRRYRSRNFSQVLGQPHVTNGLRSAVAEGREGHAYLFSGPRGTGKTSTARVLAKALNCENLSDGEPCSTCTSCLAIEAGTSFDLHELDAASHNKVDDVRDLISKVQLGSPGRTKVYILDEVHMLSSGAENALLKTLEEPPEHVVFVLATTEPQKVVPTIRSRTQHFEFHLLPADVLAEHVRWVIADAELDVDDDAIDYVLRQGGGSARDTLSALDLVAAAGGVPEGNDIAESLVRAIGERDPARAIAAVQEGLELGREPRTIGEDTLGLLRNAFLASMGAPLTQLNDHAVTVATDLATAVGPPTLTRSLESLGQALVEMRQAPDPRVPLEVVLLRLCRGPDAPPSAQGDDAAPGGGADRAQVAALESRLAALERTVAELSATPPAPAAPAAAQPAAPAAGSDQPATGSAPRSPRSPRQGARPERQATRPAPQSSAPDDQPTKPAQPPTAQPPTTQPAPEPEPEAPAPAPTALAPAPAAADGAPLASQTVIDAFPALLDALTQRVRARFKGGRILGVEGADVRFGAPHPIHRDRCEEVKADVEKALSSHFGRAVSLTIVIDDDSSAVPQDPAKITPRTPPPATVDGQDEEEDIGPVSELADAGEVSSKGVDRLTEAFPGSQVITPPPPDTFR